jgi:hypothetical protein
MPTLAVMKEARMRVRRIVHTLCGIALLGVLTTTSTGAIPNARRTTYFTFKSEVGLPGTTLPAGSYVFEVLNPDTSADLVRVMNRERTKTYALKFTRSVTRSRWGNLKSTITLGEAPTGQPQPIKTWFPEDETTGREFIYF